MNQSFVSDNTSPMNTFIESRILDPTETETSLTIVSWRIFTLDAGQSQVHPYISTYAQEVNRSQALNGTPSQSYGISLVIWDHSHTVLPSTRHKWTHPALTPARGRYSINQPRGMEDWVDLVDWLHTEMVYPPTDSHPSKYFHSISESLDH